MAGDWLIMRHDLIDDPAVLFASRELGIPPQHVVGCLHSVWSWFDRHTAHGCALGMTLADVDALAGVPGFGAILSKKALNWLSVTDNGVSVVHFDHYMSRNAKKRALSARRMAKSRAKTRCASVAQSAQQKCNHRTEQDRTEQNKTEHNRTAELVADDTLRKPTALRPAGAEISLSWGPDDAGLVGRLLAAGFTGVGAADLLSEAGGDKVLIADALDRLEAAQRSRRIKSPAGYVRSLVRNYSGTTNAIPATPQKRAERGRH